MAFSLLFACSLNHQELHSFPTRRSSDLAGVKPATRAASASVRSGPSPACSERRNAGGSVSTRSRSEEHTSELQSRRELVCRLLLEKKKNGMFVQTEARIAI